MRVLFYGQSIIALRWWLDLQDLLLTKYPQRPWRIENRAIGGCTAEFLIKTAEADVYPYYPDLLIFHDYGDAEAYAEFIHRVRSRTCADILLVGDHITCGDDPNEGFATNNIAAASTAGTPWFDYIRLPQIAVTNGACRADIRTPWKHYLYDNGLSYSNLTVDCVHLNDAGCDLMTDLLTPYLVAPVLRPCIDPYDCGRVQRVRLAANLFDLTQGTDQAIVHFTGSRLLIAVQDGRPAEADFLVDGSRPSGMKSSYVHGRCSSWPNWWFPAILKISSQKLPVVEDWTLTVDRIEGDLGPITFHVYGSVTGDDGAGRSDRDFTSNSGRVVILSEDWYWQTYQGGLSSGMRFTWSTVFNGTDTVWSSASGAGGVRWVEIIQGLDDQPHQLVITLPNGGGAQFPKLLVYHPGGSEAGGDHTPLDAMVRWTTHDQQLLLCWPESLGNVVRVSSDLIGWTDLSLVPPVWGRSQFETTMDSSNAFFRIGWP